MSAGASWRFPRLDGFSRPVDWTFQFFSPAAHRMYVANVKEGQVTPIREGLAPYPVSTVSVGKWQLDSHQALNAWVNRSGGSFLRVHPIVDVNARLRRSKEGQLEWIVVGVVRGSPAMQMVRVDATNGWVLD